MYLICTNNILKLENRRTSTVADDTSILATNEESATASAKHQENINGILA